MEKNFQASRESWNWFVKTRFQKASDFSSESPFKIASKVRWCVYETKSCNIFIARYQSQPSLPGRPAQGLPEYWKNLYFYMPLAGMHLKGKVRKNIKAHFAHCQMTKKFWNFLLSLGCQKKPYFLRCSPLQAVKEKKIKFDWNEQLTVFRFPHEQLIHFSKW